ncbi:efflux RND transporter periplasmic adaptor subunit, partial [Burkholderia sp. SIMBA_048]
IAISTSPANSAANQGSSFVVPATALFHDGAEPAVWVVRAADNALELRRVTVTRYNERTIVIGGGLKEGERVVLQGVHTVSAGEKVR